DMADVVVCQHPVRTGELVIGRAVAFAGHSIHTDYNGMLYVDRDQAAVQVEGRVGFYDETRKRLYQMQRGLVDYFGKHSHEFFIEENDRVNVPSYTVDKGVYLLGDNRSERSFDSREFGEVDPNRCTGQVFLRWTAAPGNEELGHHRLDTIQ
ncbi:MAG: S26 family signal peptidase, partial [Polyangiales bacterium]